MAIAFNEKTVTAQRRDRRDAARLILNERVKGTRVLLNRLTLAAGAKR
jgi:hypothetical protein